MYCSYTADLAHKNQNEQNNQNPTSPHSSRHLHLLPHQQQLKARYWGKQLLLSRLPGRYDLLQNNASRKQYRIFPHAYFLLGFVYVALHPQTLTLSPYIAATPLRRTQLNGLSVDHRWANLIWLASTSSAPWTSLGQRGCSDYRYSPEKARVWMLRCTNEEHRNRPRLNNATGTAAILVGCSRQLSGRDAGPVCVWERIGRTVSLSFFMNIELLESFVVFLNEWAPVQVDR